MAAIFVEIVDLASVSNFLAQSLTTARRPQDAALFVWADAKGPCRKIPTPDADWPNYLRLHSLEHF